ncbi:MAG: hypothetical protein JXQ73_18165 [Phycisphaerae bacterium]|nr:hypothetical protein [Phycisphaerae bacterium]
MSLRQWSIYKGSHAFHLRWRAGDESRLLAEIAEQVERGSLPLTKSDLVNLIRLVGESVSVMDTTSKAEASGTRHGSVERSGRVRDQRTRRFRL